MKVISHKQSGNLIGFKKWQLSAGVFQGRLINNGGGNFTIKPEANYSGPVILNYLVNDGTSVEPAILTFDVASVADQPSLSINGSSHNINGLRTFEFNGHLTYVDDRDQLLPGLALGGAFSGQFSFDPASNDSNSANTVGDYWQNKVGTGVSVDLMGNYHFATDLTTDHSFLVEVVNDHSGRDNFLIRSYSNEFPLPEYSNTHISWQLDDSTQSALSNTDLPSEIILTDWQQIFGFSIEASRSDSPIFSRIFVRGIVDNIIAAKNIFSGNEDTSIPLLISSNINDIDGSENLSIIISGMPFDALLSAGTNNGDGTWSLLAKDLPGLTLTPPSNFNGILNLTIAAISTEVTNGDAKSVTQNFVVAVNPVNDAPSFFMGANQSVNKDVGAQTVIGWATNLSKGSSDESNQVLTFLTSNDNAALFAVQPVIDADGNLNYTPATNAIGVATVTISLQDNGGTANGGIDVSASQTFTISVNDHSGVNPIIENMVPSTTGGIAGDGNGDGTIDSQQEDVVSLPALNSGSTATWATLDATSSAENVVIAGVQNEPAPTDLPAGASMPYGLFSFNLENLTQGATIPMTLYLTGNWSLTNANGNEWTNSLDNQVINGYWKQNPASDWINIASSISVVGDKLKIDFNLTDGGWMDHDGTINGIVVDPGAPGFNNNAPVAGDDQGSIDEDHALSFTIADLLVNDSDGDGDDLTPSLVNSPVHGTLEQLADGSLRYTPFANYHGLDSFTYKVNDGHEDSNVATVNITVKSVNDAPTGGLIDTLIGGTEDIAYPIAAETLLQGFTDVDGDALDVVDLTATNGTLQDDGNGGWIFQPVLDYNGQVTLTYQVSDGVDGTVDNVARTFNLAAVNDAPTGSPAGVLANGQEDIQYTILQSDLLNGFSDVDGDALSVTGLIAGSGGVLSGPATGDNGIYWTFTPNKDFNGSVSLTYGVTDSKGGNITGVDRSFYLDPVNDMPQAGDDSGTVYEDATVTVTFAALLANDIDADGSSKTIVGIDTAGTAGSVVLDTVNKTITYSANADEFDLLVNGNTTMDSFKYILQGSSGLQTSATVQISVLGVSDGNLNLVGTVQPETINGTTGEDRIKGNNGNDVLNGLDGADDLFGENGDDVLNGGDSIDNLFGGNGNDKLDGGNGNDWLAGEKGDDILTGGLGKDMFLFAKAGGNDVVTDFAKGFDKIQIAADSGITTFNQLKITGGIANGTVYTVINMDNGGQVTLTGIQSTLLDATDFIFPV